MKKWIFLFVGVALNTLQAEYLELESAYKQVLQNNDGLKSTQSAVDKQEKLKNATKMLYLPQVSLDAFYIHLQSPMNTHLFNASELGNLGGIGGIAPLLARPITLQDQNIIFI